MNPSLHGRDRQPAEFSDDQAPGMADGGGARKVRNVTVGDHDHRICQVASAKSPRPEPSTMAMSGTPKCGLLRKLHANHHGRGFGAGELIHCQVLYICVRTHNKTPTMQADIRFAMVPAIIALKPSRARSPRRDRRQRAKTANLDADGAEIGKAAKRKGGDGERARIQRRFLRAEHGEGNQFIQHHARAQQVADGDAIVPRNSDDKGDGREEYSRKSSPGSPGTRGSRAPRGHYARRPEVELIRKMMARKEISMAATFSARPRPSLVPLAAASSTLLARSSWPAIRRRWRFLELRSPAPASWPR